MNIKRAIGFSLIVYLITFAIGIILTYAFGLTLESVGQESAGFWLSNVVLAVILQALITLWHFKSPTTSANLKNGLYFGLITLATATVIDILLFIPYVATTGALQEVISYYTLPWFWLIVVLVVVTSTLTGKFLENKNRGPF